jgi:5'-3' exoribonuclease 1
VQLLMVLPPASNKLLPEALRSLMLSETSPVREFYPSDFQVDIEGKRADWEAVILLPFVDQARLLAAYDEAAIGLSAAEVARSRPGRICIFDMDTASEEASYCQSTLPVYAPSVTKPHSKCTLREPLPALPPGQAGFLPTTREVRPPGLTWPRPW